MEVYLDDHEFLIQESAVALGNFDGLHIAHMHVIENSITYARAHGIQSGVLLFDRHTMSGTGSAEVPLITTIRQKLAILERTGVDFVYITKFDEVFMRKTPRQFAQFLADRLHARAVCVGYDYRFGAGASGDVTLLSALGNQYGFTVSVADAVKLDGQIVGSTYIRRLIEGGNMRRAAKFLGRYFSLEGVVVKGLQNGRKMGFATANIAERPDMVIPQFGVYAGYVTVGTERYRSVINVGKNPTFDADKVTIESHLLHFDRDIYEQCIRVEFVEKIRDDKKFASIEALKKQIQQDVHRAEGLI